MRRVLCLLFIFCLAATPSRANLGETIKQCVARYGVPVGHNEASGPGSPFGTVTYVAGGFVLNLFIYDGKEVGASVMKSGKGAFSDADLHAIMSADTAGSAWTATKSDDPNVLSWQRSDNATAVYDQAKHLLIFTSPQMEDVLKAMQSPPVSPSSPGPSSSNATTTNAIAAPAANAAPAN